MMLGIRLHSIEHTYLDSPIRIPIRIASSNWYTCLLAWTFAIVHWQCPKFRHSTRPCYTITSRWCPNIFNSIKEWWHVIPIRLNIKLSEHIKNEVASATIKTKQKKKKDWQSQTLFYLEKVNNHVELDSCDVRGSHYEWVLSLWGGRSGFKTGTRLNLPRILFMRIDSPKL